MGSVKDLKVRKKATETELGEALFIFSNRYSIFDWGEMPNLIPYKGAALCLMGAWNFERLEEEGVRTHYIGVLDKDGRVCKTTDLKEPTNKMVIKLSRVIEPEFKRNYSYNFFIRKRGLNNFVVPLEVIYRRGAPEGSSIFKTIEKFEKENPEELGNFLAKYGLKERPKPGQLFPKIGYDFTTKFELSDRKLTEKKAYEISGLTEKNFEELKKIRRFVVDFVGKRAKETGFIDFDGKHEYVSFKGIMLGDVVGTFDENRFVLNGEQVSKEFLRQYYKIYQKEWYEDIEKAKVKASLLGIKDWKKLMGISPKGLDSRLISLIGEMYASGSDRYTNLNLFKTRKLERVLEDLKEYK